LTSVTSLHIISSHLAWLASWITGYIPAAMPRKDCTPSSQPRSTPTALLAELRAGAAAQRKQPCCSFSQQIQQCCHVARDIALGGWSKLSLSRPDGIIPAQGLLPQFVDSARDWAPF